MARYTEKKHARSGGSFVTGHDEGIGKGSHANMPQEVIMKDYPPCNVYGSSDLDDTMTHIDSTASTTVSKARKHISHQH